MFQHVYADFKNTANDVNWRANSMSKYEQMKSRREWLEKLWTLLAAWYGISSLRCIVYIVACVNRRLRSSPSACGLL
jgi:hypothetical protein